MLKNIFKKSLIIGISLLFMGASFIPSISGDVEKNNSLKNIDNVDNENFILVYVDKMLMQASDYKSCWTTIEVVSTESTDDSFRASLAVDSTGMIHVAWHDETNYDNSGGDFDIFYKCKPIGGSWPLKTEVVSTESTSNSYNPSLYVDSTGMVHVA